MCCRDWGVKVMTYWFPLPQKKAGSDKFAKLRKQGEIYVLRRKMLLVLSSDCDVPVSFDPTTKSLTALLRGKEGKENLYISTDGRELEHLQRLESVDGKKRSHIEYMRALKAILIERLNTRGLTYRDLMSAGTCKIPQVYRGIFELSIDRIVDKYFIQPE